VTVKQKTSTESATKIPDEAIVISPIEDNNIFAGLAASLAEVRKLKGVTGYILRSDTAAIIDIADQEKIIDYAILSSQIYESSVEIAQEFKIANIESVLVEGKEVKVLCMTVGENKIGIFLEKTATHESIIKRILL
jgi:predicted regulator of Ras-like GTPase activity (Roadblock/LC7/MglB family)